MVRPRRERSSFVDRLLFIPLPLHIASEMLRGYAGPLSMTLPLGSLIREGEERKQAIRAAACAYLQDQFPSLEILFQWINEQESIDPVEG